MPYARLVQAARQARLADAGERRERWQMAAWQAWSSYLYVPTSERRKRTFAEWLRMHGLDERTETTEMERKGDAERSRATAADVLTAFRNAREGPAATQAVPTP